MTIIEVVFNIFMNENTPEKIVRYVDVTPQVKFWPGIKPEVLEQIQKLESETSLKKVIHGL